MNIFQNIEYVGMLSMGAFVGGILNFGLKHINDNKAFQKVATTILGAAFSGVVFVFLQYVYGKQTDPSFLRSVFMYPVGLILSLLWSQIVETIEERITSSKPSKRILGWAHVLAVSIASIAIVVLLFFGEKIN